MRRSNSRLLISCLAGLTAIAAIAVGLAAVPPKNLTKAIETQRKLVAERPEDPAVYNDLGNLLMLVPKPADAEAAYRKAIELDPNKASALFNLGLLLQQQGELHEAEDLYQRTLKADPNHAWASYQLGSIQETRKQKSKAIDSYARAFALDPQLAFPEVNPHIVDNKLVTEAMLRAYRNDFGANRQVPKMYDDGARIASMLVPPPAPRADEAKDQTAATGATTTRQPMLGPKSAGTAGTAPGTTVLREQDLRAPAGQAGAPGAARGAGAGARPTLGGQPGTARQWNRPEPTVQEVPGGGGDDDGAQPAPVINPPSGGVYYRPGVQSTGRLNLQVAPVQSARR